jgi:hypothetical protein
MARQGRPLQELELRKIIHLLASTDMSILEIAQRTGCSRGAIATINRKYKVRDYGGHRTTWKLEPAYRQNQSA